MDCSPSLLDFLGLEGEEELVQEVRNMSNLNDEELNWSGSHIDMILRAAEVPFERGTFAADASADAVFTEINSVLTAAKEKE
jgi:hypothetical protein